MNTVKTLSGLQRGSRNRIMEFNFTKYQESHYISGNYSGQKKLLPL